MKACVLKEKNEIIIKPLNRCFSSGVFYLKQGDKNTNTIIKTATNDGKTIVSSNKFPRLRSVQIRNIRRPRPPRS